MATEKELDLREIAIILEKELEYSYGEPMGFILLVTPWSTGNSVCDYISNGNRNNCIDWLKETAQRLENNETIPATKGNA